MFGMNSRITLKNAILIFRSIRCSKSIWIICLKVMFAFQNMECSSALKVGRKRCGSRLRAVLAKNQAVRCLLQVVSRQIPKPGPNLTQWGLWKFPNLHCGELVPKGRFLISQSVVSGCPAPLFVLWGTSKPVRPLPISNWEL